MLNIKIYYFNKNTKLLQYFGIGLTLFATLGGLYLKYLNLKNIIQSYKYSKYNKSITSKFK